jgi:hypothetical protein
LEYGNQHPPTYYLSAYNGELHWGRKRGVLAAWEQDEPPARVLLERRLEQRPGYRVGVPTVEWLG